VKKRQPALVEILKIQKMNLLNSNTPINSHCKITAKKDSYDRHRSTFKKIYFNEFFTKISRGFQISKKGSPL